MTHPRPNVAREPPTPRRAAGYTLVEVLLTAVIVLLAMTGMLTMQMMGIKVTQDAYHRTQATTLAYQMTDYLRANCTNIADYENVALCDAGNRAFNDTRTCGFDEDSDTDYTPGTDPVVDHDMDDWWSAIFDAELPPWYATIQRSTQSDGMARHHIVIQWEDARVAEAEAILTDSDDDETSAATSCLTLAGIQNQDIPAGMVEVCLTTIPCAP
jgi:type IV pilus modification protein PilV